MPWQFVAFKKPIFNWSSCILILTTEDNLNIFSIFFLLFLINMNIINSDCALDNRLHVCNNRSGTELSFIDSTVHTNLETDSIKEIWYIPYRQISCCCFVVFFANIFANLETKFNTVHTNCVHSFNLYLGQVNLIWITLHHGKTALNHIELQCWWVGGWMDGWLGEWVDEWVGGQMDVGWRGGWMDRWMGGWMYGGMIEGWMVDDG